MKNLGLFRFFLAAMFFGAFLGGLGRVAKHWENSYGPKMREHAYIGFSATAKIVKVAEMAENAKVACGVGAPLGWRRALGHRPGALGRLCSKRLFCGIPGFSWPKT